MERLHQSASIKTIYRETIVAEGKSITPNGITARRIGNIAFTPEKNSNLVPRDIVGIYAFPTVLQGLERVAPSLLPLRGGSLLR